MRLCIAVCWSNGLQCVAACCSLSEFWSTVFGSVLQCAGVMCCSVWQYGRSMNCRNQDYMHVHIHSCTTIQHMRSLSHTQGTKPLFIEIKKKYSLLSHVHLHISIRTHTHPQAYTRTYARAHAHIYTNTQTPPRTLDIHERTQHSQTHKAFAHSRLHDATSRLIRRLFCKNSSIPHTLIFTGTSALIAELPGSMCVCAYICIYVYTYIHIFSLSLLLFFFLMHFCFPE